MKIRRKNNCCAQKNDFVDINPFPIPSKKTLEIVWKRLVVNGKTCPRCSGTESELTKAFEVLKNSLKSLNFNLVLRKVEISIDEFQSDPLQSNQILINGKRLEDWLNLRTGQSSCCDVCGPNDCRTVEYNGKVFETIPAELIVKACLIALKDVF